MKYVIIFISMVIFGCNKSSKDEQKSAPLKAISDSSCLQNASDMESAFASAYCALASGENISAGESIQGFEFPAAIFPKNCGAVLKSECAKGGRMKGPGILYSKCVQFCLHPDDNSPFMEGERYKYFTLASGSLGQCQGALRSSVCDKTTGSFVPAIIEKRFSSCTVINAEGKKFFLWSDDKTWNGKMPKLGDSVTIPSDKIVIMDISPPDLSKLEIQGVLMFDNVDLVLKAKSVFISGNLRIGSLVAPYTEKASIVLKEGLFLQGGGLQVFGIPMTEKEKLELKETGRAKHVLNVTHWGLPVFSNITFSLISN